MRGPMVALIVPLGGGPIDPGFGNIGGWGGPRPDQGLPGGQGGRPESADLPSGAPGSWATGVPGSGVARWVRRAS